MHIATPCRGTAAAVVLLFLAACAACAAPPVVSNVRVTELDGSVEIIYDLADPDTAALYVTLEVSSDGGTSYGIRPSFAALLGHVGSGVPRGANRRIYWNSRLDLPVASGSSYRARVTADDSSWAGAGGAPGEMIYIPAGSFQMGNNGAEPYSFADELPQHSVYLSGYWIGKYEVTRGEYRRFMEAGGYSNPAYWSSEGWNWKVANSRTEPRHWAAVQDWGTGTFTQTENHPVVGVTYYEAEAYCAWAGGHLPTEAQWEKAARWTGSYPTVFPWGNVWDAEKCNCGSDSKCPGRQTTHVGSYPAGASPYGCQDAAGNVWEWIADWYLEGYYSQTPQGGWADPQGPLGGGWWMKGIRGGDWTTETADVYRHRCSYRGRTYPYSSGYAIGFRIALPAGGNGTW